MAETVKKRRYHKAQTALCRLCLVLSYLIIPLWPINWYRIIAHISRVKFSSRTIVRIKKTWSNTRVDTRLLIEVHPFKSTSKYLSSSLNIKHLRTIGLGWWKSKAGRLLTFILFLQSYCHFFAKIAIVPRVTYLRVECHVFCHVFSIYRWQKNTYWLYNTQSTPPDHGLCCWWKSTAGRLLTSFFIIAQILWLTLKNAINFVN